MNQGHRATKHEFRLLNMQGLKIFWCDIQTFELSKGIDVTPLPAAIGGLTSDRTTLENK